MERVYLGGGKPHLFVAGESFDDVTDIREFMGSKHIDDHLFAMEALRSWCYVEENTTWPPEGKNFRDRHHWYNKAAGRGAPYNRWRQLHIDLLRRDVHEKCEYNFGWLARPLLHEVLEQLKLRLEMEDE